MDLLSDCLGDSAAYTGIDLIEYNRRHILLRGKMLFMASITRDNSPRKRLSKEILAVHLYWLKLKLHQIYPLFSQLNRLAVYNRRLLIAGRCSDLKFRIKR